MGKLYNPLKALGFKNARQVLAKIGKSNIARAASKQAVNQINQAGSGGGAAPAGGGAVPEAVPVYKKGGVVKHTGMAKVHKDELIIPRSVARKLRKLCQD